MILLVFERSYIRPCEFIKKSYHVNPNQYKLRAFAPPYSLNYRLLQVRKEELNILSISGGLDIENQLSFQVARSASLQLLPEITCIQCQIAAQK